MRISFLSNSLLTLPSVDFLFKHKWLVGLAAPDRNRLLCNQFAEFSKQAGIPFHRIRKAHLESDLTNWIDAVQPDAVVVQTFPYKIPASCLHKPTFGFFNIHPGPLPGYRGPDPVFWQIANGEENATLTLHKMDELFDTGPIVHSESFPLHQADTYGHIQSDLAYAAPYALEKLVDCLVSGQSTSLPHQTNENAAFQKKPTVDQLVVDWTSASAAEIDRLVRACNPNQNGAIAFFRGVMTRLIEVTPLDSEFATKLPAGSTIAADNERGLQVICSDGQALRLEVLHVNEGYYSGRRFCEVFEVKLGEKFSGGSFLS